MNPEIISCAQKILVGYRTIATLRTDNTFELWKKFMPQRMKIENAIPDIYFSVQQYKPSLSFSDFTPETEFEKWATIEVSKLGEIPEGMEPLIIPKSKYAVFVHKGTAAEFSKTSQIIYGEWLPHSGFIVDNRPHFTLMGEKYLGHENPESEETVWIPIKLP